MTHLVGVDIRRNSFGEKVRAHSSGLEVKVQRSRILIGHCKQIVAECLGSCECIYCIYNLILRCSNLTSEIPEAIKRDLVYT